MRRKRQRKCIPVLVFHKIIPEYDAIWPGMHPRLFEEVIILLKKNYNILPIESLLSHSEEELSKACFITFDDGYKDYLDYAYPILHKHQVHSTLFVLPFDLSNQGHLWTSTIIFLVKHYWFSEIQEFFLSHGQTIAYGDTFDDFALNLAITKQLCTLQQTQRKVIIDALHEKFERDNRIIAKELLNFDELRKLNHDEVSIASHSLTHPSFQLETNLDFIEYEIKESKSILESNLKQRVSAFAFPFAKYNALSLGVVKKYYKMCFSKINEPLDLKRLKSDEDYRFDLPRYNIHQQSAEEVFLLINGFHRIVKS